MLLEATSSKSVAVKNFSFEKDVDASARQEVRHQMIPGLGGSIR